MDSATADTNASWHICCPSLYRGLGEARRSEGCWVVVIASLLRYPLHPPHGSCFLFLDSQPPQILGLFIGMLVGTENSKVSEMGWCKETLDNSSKEDDLWFWSIYHMRGISQFERNVQQMQCRLIPEQLTWATEALPARRHPLFSSGKQAEQLLDIIMNWYVASVTFWSYHTD